MHINVHVRSVSYGTYSRSAICQNVQTSSPPEHSFRPLIPHSPPRPVPHFFSLPLSSKTKAWGATRGPLFCCQYYYTINNVQFLPVPEPPIWKRRTRLYKTVTSFLTGGPARGPPCEPTPPSLEKEKKRSKPLSHPGMSKTLTGPTGFTFTKTASRGGAASETSPHPTEGK